MLAGAPQPGPTVLQYLAETITQAPTRVGRVLAVTATAQAMVLLHLTIVNESG